MNGSRRNSERNKLNMLSVPTSLTSLILEEDLPLHLDCFRSDRTTFFQFHASHARNPTNSPNGQSIPKTWHAISSTWPFFSTFFHRDQSTSSWAFLHPNLTAGKIRFPIPAQFLQHLILSPAFTNSNQVPISVQRNLSMREHHSQHSEKTLMILIEAATNLRMSFL